MHNHDQNKTKSEKPRFYGHSFLAQPFNPWAFLATWLQVGVPLENIKK